MKTEFKISQSTLHAAGAVAKCSFAFFAAMGVSQQVAAQTKVFTAAAVNNVFTDKSGTSVKEGDVYDATKTYYSASREYHGLSFPTAVSASDNNKYFKSVTTVGEWIESKLSGVYMYKVTNVENKEGFSVSTFGGGHIYSVIHDGDWSNFTISTEVKDKDAIKWDNYNYYSVNYTWYIYSVNALAEGEKYSLESLKNSDYTDVKWILASDLEKYRSYFPSFTIDNTRITSGTYTDAGTFESNGNTYAKYIYTTEEVTGTTVAGADANLLTAATLQDYVNSTSTYTVQSLWDSNNDLYRSQNNGTTYELLAHDGNYTYVSTDLFAYATTTYNDIASNETFFADNTSYLKEWLPYTFTTGNTCEVNVDLTNYSGRLEEIVEAAKEDSKFTGDGVICKLIVKGELSDDDIKYLNHQSTSDETPNATFIDLKGATIASGATLSLASNTFVEFVVLPSSYSTSPIDKTILPSSSAFKSALAVSSDGKIISGYVGTSGTLSELTTNTAYVTLSSVTKASIAGNVIPKDYALSFTRTSYSNILDSEGHLAYEVSETQTVTTSGSGSYPTPALNDANSIKSLDLSKAVFANQKDMAPGMLGFSTLLTELVLPETTTEIPALGLQGLQNVTSLCIPGTVTSIGRLAFQGSGIYHFYTNSTDTSIDASQLDHGEYTITLPAGLTYIGTGAFATNTANFAYTQDASEPSGFKKTGFTDVYSLNTDAPVCEHDAFSSPTTWGNNGYLPLRPVRRENYRSAVLHYPSATSEQEVKNYKDVDRQYTFPSELLETDAKGNVVCYPNQAELARSWNQAVHHFTWYAWDYTRTSPFDASTGDYSAIQLENTNTIYSGSVGTGARSGNTYEVSQLVSTVDKSKLTTDALGVENAYSGTEYYDWTQYVGWHEFVLTGEFLPGEKDEPNYDFSKIKDNDWWTICVPFDMTRQEIVEVFGDGYDGTTNTREPIVTTLNGVVRNSNQLLLKFPNNLMNVKLKVFDYDDTSKEPITTVPTSWEVTAESVGPDDVVIKAGYPYMIKPYLSEQTRQNLDTQANKFFSSKIEDNTHGFRKYITENKNPDMFKKGYRVTVKATTEDGGTKVTQFLLPTAGTIYQDGTAASYKENDKVDCEYSFYGGLVDKRMPQYAYYLGTTNGKAAYKYQSVASKKDDSWKANTAIIGLVLYSELTGNESGSRENKVIIAEDDLTNTVNGTPAKQDKVVMLDFSALENNTITGITELDTQKDEPLVVNGQLVQGNVYNLNGQYVGTSLQGLSKGIYVVNGRKFAVK